MQAILTKYHGPTNVKGSRYSAACDRGRISIFVDNTLDHEGNHIAARKALVAKFIKEDEALYGLCKGSALIPWGCEWCHGTLPDGNVAHVSKTW